MEGLDTPIGATSDVAGIAIIQTLVCEVVDRMIKAGVTPPVFKSSNIEGGDAYNDKLFKTYYGYWK